jgi:hypothetical protein
MTILGEFDIDVHHKPNFVPPKSVSQKNIVGSQVQDPRPVPHARSSSPPPSSSFATSFGTDRLFKEAEERKRRSQRREADYEKEFTFKPDIRLTEKKFEEFKKREEEKWKKEEEEREIQRLVIENERKELEREREAFGSEWIREEEEEGKDEEEREDDRLVEQKNYLLKENVVNRFLSSLFYFFHI